MRRFIISIVVIGLVGTMGWIGWRAWQNRSASVIIPKPDVASESSNPMDTDRDGLTDWYEINIYRTDSHRADTDGDGATDGEEIRKGVSPKSASNERLP